MKRQNGHFWLPLARRIETWVRHRVRTSTRRWTRSWPWSGLFEWCGSLANPRHRSAQPTRDRTRRCATGAPTASHAERPTQLTGSERERRANRRWCRSRLPVRFGEEHGDQRRKGRRSWPDGHHLHGNLLWQGRSRCCAVLERRYRLLGSVPHGSACGLGSLGSGTLVLRADPETSLTTVLAEIKARRAETWVERTAVESHQSTGAVERVNREVAGLLRTLKAALEARISGKVALDHDFIRWMIRHSAWLITRFRVRASGTLPASSSGSASTDERSWSSERSSGRGPQLEEASWTSVAWRSVGLERQKAATSTLVWTIVERGDSEPCVASQEAAGGGAK